MKALFVARRYPPSVGGMQRAASELYDQLSQLDDIRLLAHGGEKGADPLVLGKFLGRTVWSGFRRTFDVIHFHDALLAPIAWAVSKTGIPVTVMAHGLDVVYPHWAYQTVVRRGLKAARFVIVPSPATMEECIARGVDAGKIRVINDGVSDRYSTSLAQSRERLRHQMLNRLGVLSPETTVLLTVGRLVARKGVRWFVRTVMPLLLKRQLDVVLVVVGTGPLRSQIEQEVAGLGLRPFVRLVGQLSDEELWRTYASSDIFVMPNVPIPGDMEGFGIVALEASTFELPVIASRLEGITSAIHEGQNGLLVDPLDPVKFADAVELFVSDSVNRRVFGHRGRQFTLDSFSWHAIAARFYDVLRDASGAARQVRRV